MFSEMIIDYDAFLKRLSSNFLNNLNIDVSKREIESVDECAMHIRNEIENEINGGDAIYRLALVHVLIGILINQTISLSSLFKRKTGKSWTLLNSCLDEMLDQIVCK